MATPQVDSIEIVQGPDDALPGYITAFGVRSIEIVLQGPTPNDTLPLVTPAQGGVPMIGRSPFIGVGREL